MAIQTLSPAPGPGSPAPENGAVTALQPVDPSRRIELLDVLRGFALMGILFNNILYFSGYAYLPFEELRRFPTHAWDEALYRLLDVVVTGKFYTLFSILFGMGFYLQYRKGAGDPAPVLKTYCRRLAILLAIGILHSLFWSGDILALYAMIGFALIPFRNAAPGQLLKWAALCILLPPLASLAISPLFAAGAASGPPQAHTLYPDMTPAAVMTVFRHGTVPQIFALNLHNLLWKWLAYLPSGRILTIFGIFLMGYSMGAANYFAGAAKSWRLLVSGLAVGLSATLAAVRMGGSFHAYPPNASDSLYSLLMLAGQVSMCLFYIAALARLMDTARGKALLDHLKPVGRMALTNYLSQSFLCVLLFYNFGFDLIGKLGLSYVVVLAVSILIVQVVLSRLWLSRFRFGPVEWVWRSLTYRRRIALRRA